MKISGIIIVKKAATHRSKSTLRLVAKRPTNLPINEVAVGLEINIPDELFKPPNIFARIDIPYSGDSVLTPEVVSSIEDAVRKSTGITIKLFS